MADSEAIKRAIALYKEGRSQRAAAREAGVPLSTLQRRLLSAGVSRPAGHSGHSGSQPDPQSTTAGEAKPLRDALGRWLPGQSANPGGKRRETREAHALAQESSVEAVQTILRIMRDENANQKVRLEAAREILDRALGKPKQTARLDVELQERRVYEITQRIISEHPELLAELFPEPVGR